MVREQLTEKHNIGNDALFRLKTILLIVQRVFKNLLSPTKKFRASEHLTEAPVIAVSESDLWNPNDNEKNWILTAGKIQNLRIAVKKINGINVKANEIFSFWRHIGNPNFGQGYVVGREIREGCIVPTIAGGLCQLSNALYDAAINANFEIIERHRHTKVIQGSLAEQNRDATVKWNYVDLRFKSKADFRIEAELTSDKLMIRFKSKMHNDRSSNHDSKHYQSDTLNDCYSCGNFKCFKHPDSKSQRSETAKTTFILDEQWIEFDEYVKTLANENDRFILPLKHNIFINSERYAWKAARPKQTKATSPLGIHRALMLRLATKQKNVFELSLRLDKKIANAAVRLIPVEATHLVISQNLLPFIYETGALGGRTFDVLMTRLPFEKLHERLDYAHSQHPESTTLIDFRANNQLIRIENVALTKARRIITPHSEIALIFKNKVDKLSWRIPVSKSVHAKGMKILFPASAVGRKGAYEIKRLAQELNLELTIDGPTIEKHNFWETIKVEKFNGNLEEIGLVIYPTYVEHRPRKVLKAMASGIPIITTTACGLDGSEMVKVVEMGNFEQLKTEVIKHLDEWRCIKQ